MSTPQRIQRQRVKGWRMPAGAVYVGRPTIFGNPFRIGAELKFPYCEVYDSATVRDHAHAVELFQTYGRISCGYDVLVRSRLTGKDLACWCRLDQPCHADTLLTIARGETP